MFSWRACQPAAQEDGKLKPHVEPDNGQRFGFIGVLDGLCSLTGLSPPRLGSTLCALEGARRCRWASRSTPPPPPTPPFQKFWLLAASPCREDRGRPCLTNRLPHPCKPPDPPSLAPPLQSRAQTPLARGSPEGGWVAPQVGCEISHYWKGKHVPWLKTSTGKSGCHFFLELKKRRLCKILRVTMWVRLETSSNVGGGGWSHLAASGVPSVLLGGAQMAELGLPLSVQTL